MIREWEVEFVTKATNTHVVVQVEASSSDQAKRRALSDWGSFGDKVIAVREVVEA